MIFDKLKKKKTEPKTPSEIAMEASIDANIRFRRHVWDEYSPKLDEIHHDMDKIIKTMDRCINLRGEYEDMGFDERRESLHYLASCYTRRNETYHQVQRELKEIQKVIEKLKEEDRENYSSHNEECKL